MFTFYYERIFNNDFLEDAGKVFANSPNEAILKILAKCGIENVREQTEATEDGITTYTLDVTQMGDVCNQRITLYQEPSLFDELKEQP